LGVEGRVGTPGWGLGRVTSKSITHTNQTNQTTSWLVHSWSTFGAWTNHGQTQTHKSHHDLDLREATTFPLIVLFVPSHETPKLEFRNSLNWDFYNFGGPITLCEDLQLR
jgi:hypothetical protein